MSDLPEPMTPPDCDMRRMPFMPLEVQRLLDSDLMAISTGDEFKAAVTLWCAAWYQVPAGSLPNDERILKFLSRAGAKWPRVRDVALRGFVLCADGRLYHPLVATQARRGLVQRNMQSDRAKRRWQKANENNDGAYAAAQPRQSRGNAKDIDIERDSESKGDTVTTPEPVTPDQNRSAKLSLLDATSAKPEKSDRGSRLPSDWTLSDEDRAFAQAEGIDPDREAGSFRDYWHAQPGAKGRKSNWSATWRNWVRRSSERKPAHVSGSRHRNGFIVLAEKLAREDRDRAARSPVNDLLDGEGRGAGRAGGDR